MSISHVFYSSPLGLEFAARKNQKGVILYRVSKTSSGASILRRGMLLKKANHIDVANTATISSIGSILQQVGFPLTLLFLPAPTRSEESLHQSLLLKKVQRKFRAHLARRKERLKKSTRLPLQLPPRPGTAPVNKTTKNNQPKQPSITTITKLLPNRCTNCGTINNFPSLRLRSLFRVCGLCKLEFDKIKPHQILFVPDTILPMPTADVRGPEHAFTDKGILKLEVLAASLGSGDLPQRAIDVTDALNRCVSTTGYSEAQNYIELNKGFDCSKHLLMNTRTNSPQIQLSPRSQQSIRSSPCILYSRWQLTEPSGLPFRRWTTKQQVSTNIDGTLQITSPSIVLQPPMEPMLKVLPTSFLGNLNDPLLQYPVSEIIQAAIDLDMEEHDHSSSGGNTQAEGVIAPDHKDGSFLVIGPQHSKLIQDVGDPYPGADKILRLDLDMQGFHGEIVVPCSSGHLHQPININGPVLAPTLLIRKAMYGAEAPYVEKRRSDIPVFDPNLSIEVTMELQRLVDVKGAGESLELASSEVAMFRLLNLKESPAPNQKKKLEIVFERRGIRGRRIINICRDGTMIPGEKVVIEAPKLQDSKANRYASASRKFGFSSPNIIIKSASYGTALGVRTAMRIDVRSILQNRVDNSVRNDFSLGIQENLDNLFGCRMSPWEGCELRINFEICSFVIRMDLPVRNMKLACEVRLGYLIRPIMSPSPVDSSAARRAMIGSDKKDEMKREQNGHGSGRPPASRWLGTFDQPKKKVKVKRVVSKYAFEETDDKEQMKK